MAYELHYWPTIQGRGEFVRLALEAAGAPYIDVARGTEAAGLGVPALLHVLHDRKLTYPPFAPPFLKDGGVLPRFDGPADQQNEPEGTHLTTTHIPPTIHDRTQHPKGVAQ